MIESFVIDWLLGYAAPYIVGALATLASAQYVLLGAKGLTKLSKTKKDDAVVDRCILLTDRLVEVGKLALTADPTVIAKARKLLDPPEPQPKAKKK